MTTICRVTAVASCALLVAGCGGGSSPSAPRAGSAAATAAPHSGTPLATETLKISFPADFHQARIVPSKSSSSSNAQRRSPAYINPSPSPYSGVLDIFVDGTDVSSAPPNTQSPDGTQSIAIPLYANTNGSTQHTIVAVETEMGLNSTNNTILAIGETDINTSSLTAGAGQTIGLTMLQNTQYIGLMSDPNDDDNDAQAYSGLSNVYTSYSNEYVCSAGQSFTVYPFAADPTGGFAAGNSNTAYGVGGLAQPTLGSWQSSNLTDNDSVHTSTGIDPSYTITYNNITDGGVILNFSVTSPAVAIYNDIYSYYYDVGGGAYPGIEELVDISGSNQTIPQGAFQTLNVQTPLTAQIYVQPQCDDF